MNEFEDAYYIVKGTEDVLGPFTVDEISDFVRSGLVLLRDSAANVNDIDIIFPVKELLTRHGKNITIEHKSGIFRQLKDIGKELIVPSTTFTKEPWRKDNRLPVLTIIGLSLLAIISISPLLGPYLLFYVVSLYFAALWFFLFNTLFKTNQVKSGKTILIFLGTQLLIVMLFNILGLSQLNPFRDYYSSTNPLTGLTSCVAGIGIIEELVKLLPIIILLSASKDVITPSTAVFYGLMSGISFGVYEGVQYQLTANFQVLSENSLEEGYVYSYLLNIARMTSLPFLHAVWCGIGSYFVGFAFLYPRYRISLYALAVLVPALLHGAYDYISFIGLPLIISLPIVILSLVLLIVYLNIKYDFHSKLAD